MDRACFFPPYHHTSTTLDRNPAHIPSKASCIITRFLLECARGGGLRSPSSTATGTLPRKVGKTPKAARFIRGRPEETEDPEGFKVERSFFMGSRRNRKNENGRPSGAAIILSIVSGKPYFTLMVTTRFLAGVSKMLLVAPSPTVSILSAVAPYLSTRRFFT